jgi:hypothetical protein
MSCWSSAGGSGCASSLGPAHALWSPLFQSASEFRGPYRLAHVIVHASGKTFFAVALHGVGGHRDDVDWAAAFKSRAALLLAQADFRRRFVAVHLGHHAIHEYDVVGNALERLQRLQAVGHRVGGITQFFQLPQSNLLVDGVVLRHEDAHTARGAIH